MVVLLSAHPPRMPHELPVLDVYGGSQPVGKVLEVAMPEALPFPLPYVPVTGVVPVRKKDALNGPLLVDVDAV